MQKKFFIIGLSIALITLLFYSGSAVAEEDKEDSLVIVKECQKDEKWNWEFASPEFILPNDSDEFTDLDFRKEFERARTKYHNTVKCVFGKATKDILDSAGKNRRQDLNTPKKACFGQEKLVKILKKGNPDELMKPLLKLKDNKENGYVQYLKALLAKQKIGKPSTNDFSVLLEHANYFDLLVENEIQFASASLYQAFQSLNELRSTFAMHIHFQCMLLNLEEFRKVTANLRKAVSTIPPLFEDCSLSK